MKQKTQPVRLKPELHRRLLEWAELTGKSATYIASCFLQAGMDLPKDSRLHQHLASLAAVETQKKIVEAKLREARKNIKPL